MRSIVPAFSWLTIFFFCISIVNLSAQAPTITSFTTAAGLATAVGNFSITATPYPSVQQGAKFGRHWGCWDTLPRSIGCCFIIWEYSYCWRLFR